MNAKKVSASHSPFGAGATLKLAKPLLAWPVGCRGESAGDPSPAPLTMAVKPLGKQPDKEREPPRVDENLIAIERLAVAGRTDANQMVPAANQRLALPRLNFPRCRIDPLQEDGVPAKRDDP